MFILIAVVALAAALALAAGVFLYDRFLDASVSKKSENLERARQSFEPELIDELVRLDARLLAANDVLTNHLAPSQIFSVLEQLTLQSVSYDALDYTVNDDGTIAVKLKGKARSVNGVALQASVFGQHNAVVNPIFSDIDLVSDGVAFNVSATINPAALRYANVFAQYRTNNVMPNESADSTEIFDEDGNTQTQEGDAFGDFGTQQGDEESL